MTLFSEIDKTNLYPTQVDETLQATINDWFQYREVCDDTYFPVYFKRVLNRDYGRYLQLLRLEPEISDFDWFVETYHETKHEHSGSNTQDTAGEDKLTHGLKVVGTNTDSHTGSVSTQHTQDEASNYDNSNETESGSNDLTRKHTQNADDNYDAKTTSGNSSSTGSSKTTNDLTETNNGSDTKTTDLTETTSGTEETLKKQGITDNTKNISKVNPQSVVFDSTAIAGGSNGLPAFDWSYASNQGQTVAERTFTGTDPDVNTSNSTKTNKGTESDTTSNTKNNTGTQQVDSSASETVNNTDTTKINRDETETENGSNSNTKTNKVGFNRDENTVNTYNEQTAHSIETTNSGDDVTSKTNKVTGSDESADYEIHSGRGGVRSVAGILGSAVAFIQSSSAWEWLEPRLEVCFMGVYDV